MTTKTIARAAAAIAAAALGLAGAVTPAQAADGIPLTYAQLLADPTVAAVQDQVTSLQAGDFTMGGHQYGADGTVVADETIVHRGALYRTQVRYYGLSVYGLSVVGISDGKQLCVRRVTASAPNSYAGDVRARWTCKKDTDGSMTTRVAKLTPFGIAEVLEGAGSGSPYAPTAVPGGGVQVDFSENGEPAGSYTFTSPASGPFTLTLTVGSGAEAYQALAYTTTPGATWRIPAVAKLKR